MKALILAAGYGSRLRPYSDTTPKPLFPINRRPMIDGVVRYLMAAGVEAIIVNTHHQHQQIQTFLAAQSYGIPVVTRYEPTLLGTGGAIRNVCPFWDQRPFIVINSDIITNIDLQKAYAFHCSHGKEVTLVMHDYPEFNQVAIDLQNCIAAFHNIDSVGRSQNLKHLAFTGIHVIDPAIVKEIPPDRFVDIIDIYKTRLAAGHPIAAYVAQNHYWCDIGTPQTYRQAVLDHLTPQAFQNAGIDDVTAGYTTQKLKGDGSDRQWFRLGCNDRSIIMVDHGLQNSTTTTEAEAFVAIGKHLKSSGVPVPEIYQAEPFCGLVFMEDLGDTHLQTVVGKCGDANEVAAWYRQVIDILVGMWSCARVNFDTSWTCQSARYDKNFITAYECRYFVDAFLISYLGLAVDIKTLASEFSVLAERAERLACEGFMHRDLQSRNIMVKNNQPYLIDFQGGRIGPLQYDLAALLIDPYVDLPVDLQDDLQDYCCEQARQKGAIDPGRFNDGYDCCRLTRNLQMLGAFGFLSNRKQKTYFAQYIPVAVRTLHRNLKAMGPHAFPHLTALVGDLL